MLAGRISEAMKLVEVTYPGLLQSNQELLFKLKCRQFVEMIGGYDRGEVVSLEPRLSCHSELSSSNPASPSQPITSATATNRQTPQPRQQEEAGLEMNGTAVDNDEAIAMETDSPLSPVEVGVVDLDHNPVDIERVLAFGRELQSLFTKVTASKPNETLKTMLQVR